MADFFKILQQAQQMQGKLQQMQEELSHRVVNGSAGGGLVSVEAPEAFRSAAHRSIQPSFDLVSLLCGASPALPGMEKNPRGGMSPLEVQ